MQSSITDQTKPDYYLFFILLIAILTHIALFVDVQRIEPFRGIAPDTESYNAPAQALLSTGSFSTSVENIKQPETTRTPGYPLFLAINYKLFGIQYSSVIIFQIIIGVFTIYLVYLICQKLWNISIARSAILLYILDFASFTYQHYVLTEALFTFLIVLAIFIWIEMNKRMDELNIRQFYFIPLSFGTILAFATLVRPVTYYLIIPIVLILTFCFINKRIYSKKLIAVILLISMPWIILIGGWQIRNYILTDSAQFSSIEGVNLLFYRAAGVLAIRDGIPLEEAQNNIIANLPEMNNLTPAQKSEIYMTTGKEIIAKQPLFFLKSQGIGFIKLLSDSGADDFLKYIGITEKSGPLSDIRVLPISGFFDKWLKKPVYFSSFLFGILYLMITYLFSSIAIITICLNKSKKKIDHYLIIGIILYFLLVSIGPEADARLRIPIMPLLSIYASAGIYIFKIQYT